MAATLGPYFPPPTTAARSGPVGITRAQGETWEAIAPTDAGIDRDRLQTVIAFARSTVESVSGSAHWGGGVWMGSGDFARFGLLYVNDGAWDGRQLLSQDRIGRTRVPSEHTPMDGYP